MRRTLGMPLALGLYLCGLAACHHPTSMGPAPGLPGLDGGAADAAPMGPLTIVPGATTLKVTMGQTPPTVQYTASVAGQPVQANWAIDRSEIGSINGASGLFTPSGATAGVAHVSAFYGSQRASTSLTVTVAWVQNGDPAATGQPVSSGPGGYGGVGGDGPGLPATTMQQQALAGTPTVDSNVQLLYPYDKTVWPRGLLAPLLQWNPGTHHFDSLLVQLHEQNFDWQGAFATPAGAAAFLDLPIPQAVWQEATYSNGGEPLTMTLAFHDRVTGAVVGPYTESWTIAQGTLKGTVYYNSYGTHLLTNSPDLDYYSKLDGGVKEQYGAGVLAIRPGTTDPVVVGGFDSVGDVTSSGGDGTGCRACHAVSANGSTLMVQGIADAGVGNNQEAEYVNLLNDSTAGKGTQIGGGLAFPAIYPDGSRLLSCSTSTEGCDDPTSKLYAVPAGTPIVPDGGLGLPSNFRAALPVFSPDGKHVAFNYWGGSLNDLGANKQSLAMMDFDAQTNKFSNLQILYTPPTATPVTPVSWSSFLPNSAGIVFEVELINRNGAYFSYTYNDHDPNYTGNRAELWWIDLATKQVARLDQLNGLGYAPVTTNHPNDAIVNYEPTVNPIVSAGYAWVVFTSRRLYGNVATAPPQTSDPKTYPWKTVVTPKKLWVAAIDLNAPPGTDPSHPAFYLPAQEILAESSRGFWSVSPCAKDGAGCSTGDECCGGYCRVGNAGGAPLCTSQAPTCANEYEKCSSDADCCAGLSLSCIDDRCANLIR